MKKAILLSCLPLSLFAEPISEAPNARVNYPSNFQVEGGCNLFLFGEYLYWTANEDGLYFAQTGLQNTTLALPSDDSAIFRGKLKKVHPRFHSGARAGLGLNFPKAGYDLVLYATWFALDSHASASGHLLPLWAEPDFTPFAPATHASGKWNLDLKILDLEWGRSSWFGGHLSLRPFFGLRGALIDQDFKVHYTFATSPAITERLRAHADFRGGGMRAGVDTRFSLPAGFGVYGIASGSLLYGHLNSNLRIREDATSIARTKDHLWKGLAALQLALGLGWDSHFAKDRLHIEFHVGWESNLWFHINQMNHFLNQLSTGTYFKENGNLSTQGLVAGGRFDF